MRTIAFYSYKGGTGRTLVVANAAKYLVRLGLKVFAIDLDLEAPGLHYKVDLAVNGGLPPIERGVVDFLTDFLSTQKVPDSLRPYTIEVAHEEEHGGTFTLMPAGNAPSAQYWRKLTRISWHDLFYSEEPQGIPLFLELKQRIGNEFAPDFLLIDSRTGITEIGGVATSVLPEQVVCLLVNNKENMEGARAVLRSFKEAVRLPGQDPIDIVPVLSRIPARRSQRQQASEQYLTEMKEFLCEESESQEATLSLKEVLVLHSEDDLQYRERLRIGGDLTVDESPLLRDYLRLFSHIVPKELVEPRLDKLVRATEKDMLDSPLRVQQDLEAIASYCPHPESYLALLKYYRLRNAGAKDMLTTAARYWELSRDTSNPLLWETVREHFKFRPERRTREPHDLPLEFVEAVWDEAGADDVPVGLALADAYFAGPYSRRKALDVLDKLLASRECSEDAVVGVLERLMRVDDRKAAENVIERFSDSLADRAHFQAKWAEFAVKNGDVQNAKNLVELKNFRPAKLQAEHPVLYVRLLKLAGHDDEVDAALKNCVAQVLTRGGRLFGSSDLMELAQLFFELGKRDEFEQQVKRAFPKREAERFLEHVLHY